MDGSGAKRGLSELVAPLGPDAKRHAVEDQVIGELEDIDATPGGDCRQDAVRLVRQRCSADVAGPGAGTVSRAGAYGHVMMRSGTILWCRLCGRYSTLRGGRVAVGLEAECPLVPPRSQKSLYRLLKGRHPVSGVVLESVAVRLTTRNCTFGSASGDVECRNFWNTVWDDEDDEDGAG